jgi:hypothetical protein
MQWFIVQGWPVGGGGGGGYPDNTLPQPPLGIWGPGQMPPGVWPTPPSGGGGGNYPSQGPGFPTHPIAPGGGGNYPSQGPGFPTNPIAPGGGGNYPSQGPGFPTNPIAPGGMPPGINHPVFPSHPIVIPPPPGSGGGAVAVIPAGTSVVSTADIEIQNPSDPENPFVIPSGTVIVTAQPLLVASDYESPEAGGGGSTKPVPPTEPKK